MITPTALYNTMNMDDVFAEISVRCKHGFRRRPEQIPTVKYSWSRYVAYSYEPRVDIPTIMYGSVVQLSRYNLGEFQLLYDLTKNGLDDDVEFQVRSMYNTDHLVYSKILNSFMGTDLDYIHIEDFVDYIYCSQLM